MAGGVNGARDTKLIQVSVFLGEVPYREWEKNVRSANVCNGIEE